MTGVFGICVVSGRAR
eukprot:UN0171